MKIFSKCFWKDTSTNLSKLYKVLYDIPDLTKNMRPCFIIIEVFELHRHLTNIQNQHVDQHGPDWCIYRVRLMFGNCGVVINLQS